MTLEEFERLFAEYYRRLVNWTRGKCPPDIDAEEYVNAAFVSLKAARSYATYQPERGSVLRWFQGAIQNVTLRDLQAREREAKGNSPVRYKTDHVECPGCGHDVPLPDRKGRVCPSCKLGLPRGIWKARSSRIGMYWADRRQKRKLEDTPDTNAEDGQAAWSETDRRIKESDKAREVTVGFGVAPVGPPTDALEDIAHRTHGTPEDKVVQTEDAVLQLKALRHVLDGFSGIARAVLADRLGHQMSWDDIAKKYPNRSAREWRRWFTNQARGGIEFRLRLYRRDWPHEKIFQTGPIT